MVRILNQKWVILSTRSDVRIIKLDVLSKDARSDLNTQPGVGYIRMLGVTRILNQKWVKLVVIFKRLIKSLKSF